MKENAHIENRKYDPEDILHIAQRTYTEMVENGSWNSPSMVQDSGFVVNSSCWNCEGKGHNADECSFKNTSVSNPSGSNLNIGREKRSAPRNGEPKMKAISGKPFKYNRETKC